MFNLLHPDIQSALEKMGITEPTLPQRRVIPLILKGKNILLISPTGSGKTEAAMLPIFDQIIKTHPPQISCIYITPLRALNRDMLKRLEEFGKHLNIKIAVRHGDTPQHERRKLSLNPPDVLITTPETFQIMFLGSRLRKALENVKYIVIDEVHELASDERGAQLSVALERLREKTSFKIIGLSATVGNAQEIAKFLSPNEPIEIVESSLFKKIDISVRAPSQKYPLNAEKMGCDVEYASTLVEMWNEIKKHRAALVFVNTRSTAEDIGMRYHLLNPDLPVEVHHGSLSRNVRIEAEEKFKAGKLKALICTSSLELGIDVGIVDLVLQYNSPRQVTKLLQRVGRAGHTIKDVSKGIIFAHTPVELWEACSIATLAKEGKVEHVRIREKPIMVLANQIVAMANSEGRVNAHYAYSIVKKAYPFRNLSFEEFIHVLEFLADMRKIWYDGFVFGKSRSGMRYFYDNISMIPDEKNYSVITLSGDYIGHLDESFVSALNIGETFVMKGTAWRIMDIKEDKIIVEYIRDIALPPSWVGEEIPVPYEVANAKPDMGFLNYAAREIIRNWKMDWDENRVVIEKGKGFVFVGIRLGTRGNYTLGLILSSILSQRIGESVEFTISPYHIAFFNPYVREDLVEEILLRLRDVSRLVKILARNSRLFSYIFMHVAKKMGVIRKGADLKKIRLEKIISSYENTVLYEEVLNKLLFDYMDVDIVESFLSRISRGEVKIVKRSLSKTAESLMHEKGDLASPIVATRPIIEAVYRRLMEEELVQICLSCGAVLHIKVKNFEKPVCPVCGSIRVALVKPYDEKLADIVKKKKLTLQDRKEMDRLMGISHLLRRHRKSAAMVLAGRGIGLNTASRILEIPYEDDYELVKRILKEELKFARTKQFWD